MNEHNKKTLELYRCKANLWHDLSYMDALDTRIHQAKKAMAYYKSLADVTDKSTKKYDEYVALYIASEKAVKYNLKYLKECNYE